MLVVEQCVVKYNLAVMNNNVRTLLRYISRHCAAFDQRLFVEHLSLISSFPYVSVRDVLEASSKSGAEVVAKMVSVAELQSLTLPIVAVMGSEDGSSLPQDSVQVVAVNENEVSLADDLEFSYNLSLSEFSALFTGIVIYIKPGIGGRVSRIVGSEGIFRHLVNAVNLLALERLVLAFERQGFKRLHPTVSTSSTGGDDMRQPKGLGFRSFLDCQDVSRECASIIGLVCNAVADSAIIEGIACLKLPVEDRFITGFDNGVNLYRKEAFHFPYNTNGEEILVTRFFPKEEFHLSSGDALSITCGDDQGRISWNAEWKLRPPSTGVTYLFSLWHRGTKGVNLSSEGW